MDFNPQCREVFADGTGTIQHKSYCSRDSKNIAVGTSVTKTMLAPVIPLTYCRKLKSVA